MVVSNNRITVVTAPINTDLTTKATVKARLNITNATSDSLLDVIIAEVSDVIKRYTQADFAGQEITELTEGRTSQLLRLSNYPILSLSALTLDGVTVAETEFDGTRFDSGFVYNKCKWCDTNSEFIYSVTYIYGYELPSFVTNPLAVPDLPKSIEEAAILLTTNVFISRQRDSSIQKEAIPDVYSATYGGTGNVGTIDTLITGDIKTLLEPFRRYKI